MMDCPNDTNGDGNCGRSSCPYCGPNAIERTPLIVPAPGWKSALNAAHFRVGGRFGWQEHGRLWAATVVEVDARNFRVKVRDVQPGVLVDS